LQERDRRRALPLLQLPPRLGHRTGGPDAAAGVPVGLGVDGSASNDSGNLVAEARQAMLLQRVTEGAEAFSARDALRLATRGGAEVLGRGGDCGQIAPGFRADLAIWDMTGVEAAGNWDPAALLLAGPTRVRDLIVNGRVVVEGGHLRTVDLDRVLAHQRSLADALAVEK
jgi:cytosine/adenosine deaminase-related metal-dependent hydrolase